MSQFPDDTHGTFHELFVGGQFALGVVDVVLEANPNVAAQDEGVGRLAGSWAVPIAETLKMQFSGSASTNIWSIFGV